MFDRTRGYLERVGLPTGDATTLPSSPHTFADGGQFRWEMAGAITAHVASALIDGMDDAGLHLNQVTYTEGVMRLTDRELEELVSTVHGADRQLVMAVGPRGSTDVGGQRLAPAAVAAGASAYRLRGMEQVVRAVEDVRRAADAGVRGFLVFDEGLLLLLMRMRDDRELPDGVRFKASSNMGVANPMHALVIAQLGADSINLQRDLDLAMIAAVRSVTAVPFDLHTDNPAATGGFLRTYEVPEMVRIGAPLYLKTGNAAQRTFDAPLGPGEISDMVRQARLEMEMIARHAPQLRASRGRDF
jgi:hypothetical protein